MLANIQYITQNETWNTHIGGTACVFFTMSWIGCAPCRNKEHARDALHVEDVYFTLFIGEGNTGAFQKCRINAFLFTPLPPWGFSEKLTLEK